MSMKNPMTRGGIEPATFRFVAQRLNHCAPAVPFVQIVLPKTRQIPVAVVGWVTAGNT